MTTSTLTPRQSFREAVAQVAARAHAKLPECNGRIDSAVKLVLLGEVTLLPDGTATVGSCTDPTKTYTVNGTCTCKDYERAPGQLCKHRLAYGIARRAQELLPTPSPEPVPPTAAESARLQEGVAALPEARASINVRLTIGGRECQLTLRDHDEARLLVRLEEVLQRYPQPQPPAQPARQSQGQGPREGKGWCHKHGVQMTQTTKEGRSWWSHRTADGWCKGR